MNEEAPSALAHLVTGISAGSVGRIIIALHSGERRWPLLLVEGLLGGLVGAAIMSALVYYDPSLRSLGFGLMISGGACGFAGALGTRLLDMFTLALKKKLGL